MNDEKIKVWKGKLAKLEEALKQFNHRRLILISILDELSRRAGLKPKDLVNQRELQAEISYLDDCIKAYEKYINECKIKLIKEQSVYGKDTEERGVLKAVSKKTLIKYTAPLIIIILIFASLFLLKPEITGRVVLSKETAYNKSINLEINESGNYTWNLNKPVDIRSIKATGSVTGNGTVKIYIEKDGKRYLIYKNK